MAEKQRKMNLECGEHSEALPPVPILRRGHNTEEKLQGVLEDSLLTSRGYCQSGFWDPSLLPQESASL